MAETNDNIDPLDELIENPNGGLMTPEQVEEFELERAEHDSDFEIDRADDGDEYAYGAAPDEREEHLLPGEDMDGDHESALASAGFGTDEDYNHYDTTDQDFEDRISGGGDFDEGVVD